MRKAKVTEEGAEEKPKEKKKMELPDDYGMPVQLPELTDDQDIDREKENEQLLELCRQHLDIEDVDENQIPKIFKKAKTDTKAQILLNKQINKMAELVGLREILTFINYMWLEDKEILEILSPAHIFNIQEELKEYVREQQARNSAR